MMTTPDNYFARSFYEPILSLSLGGLYLLFIRSQVVSLYSNCEILLSNWVSVLPPNARYVDLDAFATRLYKIRVQSCDRGGYLQDHVIFLWRL